MGVEEGGMETVDVRRFERSFVIRFGCEGRRIHALVFGDDGASFGSSIAPQAIRDSGYNCAFGEADAVLAMV